MLHIARILGLTDIRLVSRRSNGVKRTGKVRSEGGSGLRRERKRRNEMQLNRWAIGWTNVSIFLITAGIGSRRDRRGNVVTGNGTALRRCSPDGRTNVRVLLFQLCGLPVLPLRLFHRLVSLPRLHLALFLPFRDTCGSMLPFTSIDPVSFFFWRTIWNSRPSEREIVNKWWINKSESRGSLAKFVAQSDLRYFQNL